MNKTNRNPKVDDYIATSAEFAKPIMTHLRDLIHRQCPDVLEGVRWGIPHFDYKGDILCIIAAYRAHCSFTLYKDSLMSDPRLRQNHLHKAAKRYMGHITSLGDLPRDEELTAFINEAMKLNEKGIKLPPRESARPKQVDVPDDFAEALAENPKARETFEGKSDSFRKDYIIWITDAKTEATRNKRIDEALQWIAEGKSRFWKYDKRG